MLLMMPIECSQISNLLSILILVDNITTHASSIPPLCVVTVTEDQFISEATVKKSESQSEVLKRSVYSVIR